jgi:predicted branched-subunit amino acid permease
MSIGFSGAGFRRGLAAALPLGVGMIPFGLVTGLLAARQGLSALEAALMSGLVYAGASQVVALETWSAAAPFAGAATAAFIVNLRFALMGPVAAPWIEATPPRWRWFSIVTLVDHAFALAVTEMRQGRNDAAFLPGAAVGMWVWWVAATVAGHLAAGALSLARDHPLFFAAPAAFIALLVPLWRGMRHDGLPWLAAAAAALLTAQLLPGAWHIAAGGVVGAALGALRDRTRPA